MLQFNLHKNELGYHKVAKHRGEVPFVAVPSHRMIERLDIPPVDKDDSWTVIARERVHGGSFDRPALPRLVDRRDTPLHEKISQLVSGRLDWQMLVVEPKRGLATLSAGSGGLLPCYLTYSSGFLVGGSDLSDALAALNWNLRLDVGKCANYIARGEIAYGPTLPIENIFVLTAGTTIRIRFDDQTGQSVRIIGPNMGKPSRPEDLNPEQDPVKEFEDVLKNAMRLRLGQTPRKVAVELSGGLDSGIVTGIASQSIRDVALPSIGIRMIDAERSQDSRRKAIVERFNVTDRTINLANNIPDFSKRKPSLSGVLPWGEFYYEAFEKVFSECCSFGSDIVLTGLGGDELFSESLFDLSTEEIRRLARTASGSEPSLPDFMTSMAVSYLEIEAQQQRAYVNGIPASTFDAHLVTAPQMHKWGIWPISPFADAKVVDFCQKLPAELRRERTLQRKLLQNWDLPQFVWGADDEDDFSMAIQTGLHRSQDYVHKLFSHSRLSEVGIVNKEKLMDCYDRFLRASDTPQFLANVYSMYLVISLEHFLAQVDRIRSSSQNRG